MFEQLIELDKKIEFSQLSLPLVKWVEKENHKFMMFFHSDFDKEFIAYQYNFSDEDINTIINDLKELKRIRKNAKALNSKKSQQRIKKVLAQNKMILEGSKADMNKLLNCYGVDLKNDIGKIEFKK